MLFRLVVVVDNFNDEDDSDSLLELLETDVVIGLKGENETKVEPADNLDEVDVRKEAELKLLLELATLELEVLEVDVVDFGGVQPPITDGTALTPAVIGMMFVPQLAACARRTLALSWSYTTIHHQLFAQPSEHGYLLYADRMNESPKRKNSVLGTAANQH
jgi:hypothetical protein